jgi:ABC-type lipoprotein release transport system permease subunit
MAIKKFWTIAYRDLARNRRRTLLTMLAVALGMMVLIMMSGFIAGAFSGALRDNIRLNTGHLQLRADAYEIEKLSLLSKDLLPDGESLAAQAQSLGQVESATPVLWTSGVLSTIRESTGLQVTGIDPAAAFHAPIQNGMVAGQYLAPNARNDILLGKRLADDMGVAVGQRVSLAVGTANGQPDEAIFTVVGLFDTGIPNYDQNTVIMPLSRAQAFTGTGKRASSVIVLLNDREDVAGVAAALQAPGVKILNWQELNSLLLETAEMGIAFYYIIYFIVILVVAVLIANTLLMSVFERTREMGILAALGMKGRQIMLMFLFEATILALAGIALGQVLGFAVVAYLSQVGIGLSEDAMASVEGFAYGSRMYAEFAPDQAVILSLFMFVVVTLVSLYPAWYAARLEPVKALHTL